MIYYCVLKSIYCPVLQIGTFFLPQAQQLKVEAWELQSLTISWIPCLHFHSVMEAFFVFQPFLKYFPQKGNNMVIALFLLNRIDCPSTRFLVISSLQSVKIYKVKWSFNINYYLFILTTDM